MFVNKTQGLSPENVALASIIDRIFPLFLDFLIFSFHYFCSIKIKLSKLHFKIWPIKSIKIIQNVLKLSKQYKFVVAVFRTRHCREKNNASNSSKSLQVSYLLCRHMILFNLMYSTLLHSKTISIYKSLVWANCD